MRKFLPLLFFCSIPLYASSLQVVTSDFPPYQIQNGNQVEGINTALIKKVIAQAGSEATFQIYPWTRAYEKALQEPNTLIYSIARTPEREKLFQWIGTISPFQIYLWKLKNRTDINIKALEDAKPFVIGGITSDVKAKYFQQMGFTPGKNLEFASNEVANIKKLYAKRIDLMAFDEISFPYLCRRAGHPVSDFTRLLKIDDISHDLYLAASLTTPLKTVKELTQALRKIKREPKTR